jgi:outer membrane biosynthesis protein TonB
MKSRSLLTNVAARCLIALLTIALCTTADMRAYAQQVQLPPPDSVLAPVSPAAQEQPPLPDAPSAARLVAAQEQQPEVVPVGPDGKPVEPTRPEQPTEGQTAPAPTPEPAAPAPAATTQNQDQRAEQPLGTAAAEKGKTRGGAASKPAGVAIAPAKQKRSKSFLIKLGAVAAGAAALGAVYALTRSTDSTPPGATR